MVRDPELKSLPNGTAVANFSVATSKTYKDKNGTKQENTEFHNIIVFGRMAETCNQFLKKGQLVMIEGSITTRSWDKKDGGGKAYKTEIIASAVQFGPRSNREGKDDIPPDDVDQSQPQAKQTAKKAPSKPYVAPDKIEYPEEEINPEDIPF